MSIKTAVVATDIPSPNFSTEVIPVEFLVIHYTACNLADTLRLFTTPEKKVCAHFVLDVDGQIYDLGNFMNGPIRQGAHAGVSHWTDDGRTWESFNRFSIGIEIVNFNGNFFDFTPAQYDSLVKLTKRLQERFQALKDPKRVVGHEQIAGFRGKCDPGLRFDWKRYFNAAFVSGPFPSRPCVFDETKQKQFEVEHGKVEPEKFTAQDWAVLSSKIEAYLGKRS
jgi:N-acetyl-anhydromuramyl-L-alanine amidase AmpD